MKPWERVPLTKVATIDRDIVEAKSIRYGTMYVGLENMATGGGLLNVTPVSEGELASSKFAFSDRHVLFGKLRPYLAKIARPTFGGVCSTDILPILPSERIDRGYLAQFLLYPQTVEWASSRATGANLPRLSPRILAELPVPMPPLAEQRRIAEVLDRAEGLKEKKRESLKLLAALQDSSFLALFGDAAANNMRWPRVPLAELILDGPQNGLYKPATDYGSGIPIVRIDAFYNGVITKLASLKRVRIGDEECAKYRLSEGDILINRVNSLEYLGKSAIVPLLAEPTVFESNMMRFGVDRARIDPEYLIAFLQTPFVSGQVRTAAKKAVNQASINQQDVKALLVNLPPLTLQREFRRRTDALRHLRLKLVESLRHSELLHGALQESAFGGKL